MKKLFLSVVALVLLMPNLASADQIAVPQQEKLSSINQIKEYVLTSRDVNVMLYDENGNIINEFHSDGNVVDYQYDATGKMISSTDSYNGMQIYELDEETNSLSIKTYANSAFVNEKKLVSENELPLDISEDNTIPNPIVPFAYESTVISGVNMNTLITDADFINSSTMSSSAIQKFFEDRGSILKNVVLIYYLDSSGKPYFNGHTINAASAISSAATTNGVNSKVILATLQKESSLISATPGSVDYSSRRFYYAMGYGATDSGDDRSKGGFNYQISGGTQTLKNRYTQSPSSGYPIKLPDGTVTSINFGKSVTSGGVTYKNYVWVDNRATYSLYRYTPHTIDTSLLPSIGGGNYLFVKIATGWWGSSSPWR
ncbi:RHS repeat domain-containing protein [Paenibacillus sp. EZ-K15]|uniref:RHS repeat domain-containing protein n=1 Tax=Paenibacillus sp. EZ-K15 TaxID=2044275 RepID=UPI000BF31A36|nr:RHS repeat domain-containing protein [Paenibacillus sp. EZ-K15]